LLPASCSLSCLFVHFVSPPLFPLFFFSGCRDGIRYLFNTPRCVLEDSSPYSLPLFLFSPFFMNNIRLGQYSEQAATDSGSKPAAVFPPFFSPIFFPPSFPSPSRRESSLSQSTGTASMAASALSNPSSSAFPSLLPFFFSPSLCSYRNAESEYSRTGWVFPLFPPSPCFSSFSP